MGGTLRAIKDIPGRVQLHLHALQARQADTMISATHLMLCSLDFMYLFCSLQTVLRIWDCLFYEGSKILFRVALTLIHHNEALIHQAQSLPDVCQTFKQMTHGPFVDNCHSFMQVHGKLQTSAQVPKVLR